MSGLNELSAEVQQACDAAASRHHVSAAIDPHDWIFLVSLGPSGCLCHAPLLVTKFRQVSEVHMR